MTIHIEQIDTRNAPEETLRALHELYLEWDKEWDPNYPDVPWEQRLADWRHVRDFTEVPRWVAFDGARVVATAGLHFHREQDLDNCFGWVFVSADHRRQGIARLVAKPSLEYGHGSGRKRYATLIKAGTVHSVWPDRLGLKAVYNERGSHMRIAEVDRTMLEEWIERASERAQDYELLFLDSPIPEEYRDRFLAVTDVMNTAPLEDLEEDPMHWSDQELRDAEEMEALKKKSIYTAVARHKPTGDFAGYTQLVYQSLHPAVAQQWDTGVDPVHRNLGLGRWLKAAMLLRVLDEHPDIEVIETENAESNEPMLNINVAMGFKPALELVIYQGDIQTAQEYLNSN